MSHTSGVWECHGGEILAADGDVIIAVLVARGQPCAVENPNEAEANARLIAAAPDLLAALKLAVDDDSGFACPESVYDQMVAAIAKAEGR